MFVIDPGHGGHAAIGASTPTGARSTTGILEKDVTWSLARRMADALPGASLTRQGDHNVGLERRVAASAGAQAFLSVHANAGEPHEQGAEVWVHSDADPASQALGRALVDSLLANGLPLRGLFAGKLAVLDPTRQQAPAALVEADFLTHPEGARRLGDPAYLDRMARSLGHALRTFGYPGGADPRSWSMAQGSDPYDRFLPIAVRVTRAGAALANRVIEVKGLQGSVSNIGYAPLRNAARTGSDGHALLAIRVSQANVGDLLAGASVRIGISGETQDRWVPVRHRVSGLGWANALGIPTDKWAAAVVSLNALIGRNISAPILTTQFVDFYAHQALAL